MISPIARVLQDGFDVVVSQVGGGGLMFLFINKTTLGSKRASCVFVGVVDVTAPIRQIVIGCHSRHQTMHQCRVYCIELKPGSNIFEHGVAFLGEFWAPPDHMDDVGIWEMAKRTSTCDCVSYVVHNAFVPCRSFLHQPQKTGITLI